MTAAADSHWESRPVPFMDHNCTTRSRFMPFTSSIVAFPGSSAFTARCNGALTYAGPHQALQPSFTLRRSGVSDEGASRITVELCVCARAMG
jgi:hypothetical protein